MSHETILTKAESLQSAPIAFQALWDGDTLGWFISFSALTKDGQSHPLGVLTEGGDIRLLNGQVPPWSEAIAAQQLGSELAKHFKAAFYFPSPTHPEADCPNWEDRNKGYPCWRCGILLLQRDDCPWHGICYYCHLEEKREQREAQWTPEQRVGPRCHICGNPATGELNDGHVCADCLDKYEVYNCEKCQGVTTISKSIHHTSLCRRCELHKAIDALTATQRNAIIAAMAKNRFAGIKSVMDIMGCSLYEAQDVLHVLNEPNDMDSK